MAITINIPTTARQDEILQQALLLMNDTGMQYQTVNEAMTALVTSQLQGWALMVKEREAASLELAYRNANAATRQQVKALLGVS